MADILNTNGEEIEVLEGLNYDFIKSIDTTLNEGLYIKLPSKEFIFSDFSKVETSEILTGNLRYGYQSNKELIELESSYEV